jgi:predicted phosphodiesterase
VTDLLGSLSLGPPKTDKQKLGKLVELLERSGIDPDEIGRVEKIKVWQGFHKNSLGEAEVVDLSGVVLSPSWETGPQWPVVAQGPVYKLPKNTVTPWAGSGWDRVVVLPDMQIGYFRDGDDSLVSTHDEAAIEVAVSIVKKVRPTQVILLGDNLDLPEFGRYAITPAFLRTTQATIDWATKLCASLRASAPSAEIIWLAGNHEERLPRWLASNAGAAFGLRRGKVGVEQPTGWPVLSVPFLCRMDEYDIDYRPGYPASAVWVTDKLKVVHGDRVKSKGSTAHAYLSQEQVSVVYGHIHRREWAEVTREDHAGHRTIMAASPGCLARIDGAVPSYHQGTDLDGRPLIRHENWQQGIAVIDRHVSGEFLYQQVPIFKDESGSWARFEGREYRFI